MATIEIRIHGVSGTPPDAMLSTDPIEIERRAGGSISVLAPPPANPNVRAYRWSSLTSGTATSALWLALIPFMLSNLAGFSLPRLRPGAHRIATLLVRTSGLALTAMFSFVTAQGFIDVGAYQYLNGKRQLIDPGSSIALGALVAAVLVIALWVLLSRRRNEPESSDPIDSGPLPAAGLSGTDLLVRRRVEIDLRSLHLATALLAITWIQADAFGTVGIGLPAWLTVFSLVIVPVAGLTVFLLVAFERPRRSLPAFMAIASATALTMSALIGAAAGAEGDLPDDLSLERHQMSITVGVLLLLVASLLVTNLTSRHPGNAAVSPALITIAGASGAGVGAALIQVSADATGGEPPTWIAPLAGGFLIGTLVVLAGAVLTAIGVAPGRERGGQQRLWITIRRMRDRLQPVFIAILVVTAILSAGFIGQRFGWWPFAPDARWAAALAGIDLVLAAWLLVAVGRRGAAIGSVVVGLAVFLAARLDAFERAPLDQYFHDFDSTATTITVLIPLGLVISRMAGALRNRDERRGLAVLWDVGAFFPRWHHPFAPPSYGPTAVRYLAEFVKSKTLAPGGVILAPHSQGSVITVAALQLLDPIPHDVALLTFGSPVGTLYRQFFPALFPDLVELEQRIPGRWINLFREDDPIAGPIAESIDHAPLRDPHLRVHGLYWLEPEYAASIEALRQAVETGG